MSISALVQEIWKKAKVRCYETSGIFTNTEL